MNDVLGDLVKQGLVDYYVCKTVVQKWPRSWFGAQLNQEFRYDPGTGEFTHIPERDTVMSSRFDWWRMGVKIAVKSFIKALHGPIQFCRWAAVREGCEEHEDAYNSYCRYGPFWYTDCYVLDDVSGGIDILGFSFKWYDNEFGGKGFQVRRIR